MRIAKQVSSLEDDADATILDTVARVYYEQGDLNQAIEWQKKAIDSGGGANSQIRRALEKYESELAAAAETVVAAETEAETDTETLDAAEATAESVDESTPDEPAEERADENADDSAEADKEDSAEVGTPPNVD
jgi:uncharacterized membrane protein YukC